MHTYMHAEIDTCIHLYIHACMHAYVTCLHTYMNTCMHAYKKLFSRQDIHTCAICLAMLCMIITDEHMYKSVLCKVLACE